MATTRSQHLGRLVALYVVCALTTAAYAGSFGGAYIDKCCEDVKAKRNSTKDPNMPDPDIFYELNMTPATGTSIRISLLQCEYICHRTWQYCPSPPD